MSTGKPNSAIRTRISAVNSTMSPNAPNRTASGRSTSDAIAHDAAAEYFHLFELRAELQQQQIDTGLRKFADLLLYLRGVPTRADRSPRFDTEYSWIDMLCSSCVPCSHC